MAVKLAGDDQKKMNEWADRLDEVAEELLTAVKDANEALSYSKINVEHHIYEYNKILSNANDFMDALAKRLEGEWGEIERGWDFDPIGCDMPEDFPDIVVDQSRYFRHPIATVTAETRARQAEERARKLERELLHASDEAERLRKELVKASRPVWRRALGL